MLSADRNKARVGNSENQEGHSFKERLKFMALFYPLGQILLRFCTHYPGLI